MKQYPNIYKLLGTAPPPNFAERCKCGHTESEHLHRFLLHSDDRSMTYGITSGDCTECDCISFWPASHDYDINAGELKI